MESGQFIEQLGIMVMAGAIGLYLGRLMRLPGVVAYLLVGFLLGPVFGVSSSNEQFEWVLETGISLMLFLVGLEMSPELVKHLKGKPLLSGAMQVTIVTVLSMGFLLLFKISIVPAIICGFALALSSTIVVLKMLQDQKDTRSSHGQLALAILLTQDFVVILGLTLIEAIGKLEEPGLAAIGIPLLKTVASLVLLFGFCYLILKIFLEKLFAWSRATPDLLLVVSLAWCFGIVELAHMFHLSAESGAFMAGLLMARIPQSEDLRRRVHPLMQLFVAIFFISLAARMDIQAIASDIVLFLSLAGFIMIVKPIMMFGIFRSIKWRKRIAFRTSLLLGQISEFSLIFLALASKSKLIDDSIANLFLALALVSFPANILVYQLIFSWLRPAHDEDESKEDKSEKPIIVIGMNTLGKLIVKKLISQNANVIAVDTDPRKLKNLKCKTIIGSIDYQETLEDMNIHNAQLVISALRIEEANELIAYWCKCHGIQSCIHGVDMNNLDRLLDNQVAYLILPKVDGIKKQVQTLKELGLLKS